MITEDYVSFEVAKLLKEKGFDEDIETEFISIDNIRIFKKNDYSDRNSTLLLNEYSAPTHQMAMKWLREVYNRYIEISTDKGHNFVDIVFRPAVYDGDLVCLYESDNFPSYEQAVEAALKYSLENLV